MLLSVFLGEKKKKFQKAAINKPGANPQKKM